MNVEIKRDGLTLRGIEERPSEKAGPMVIMFHGFNGNAGYVQGELFAEISDSLVASGISTIRFDFDGHGKSDGDFSDMDVLREIEDAIAILKYVRSKDYVTDIYVLGHSQGGVVGGILSGLYPDVIRKLVLLAAAATLKDDAIQGTCMGVRYDTEHIPDIVELDNGQIKVGGHYFRIAKNLPVYEVTSNFTGPALIVYGRKDAVVAMKAAEQYGKALKNGELRIFDGLDHGINGYDHNNVINEVVTFLLGR